MKITVFENEPKVAIGDIIEFVTPEGKKNNYYLVCYNHAIKQYFLMSLKGNIRDINYYPSTSKLLSDKENYRIHLGKEAHLSLNLGLIDT